MRPAVARQRGCPVGHPGAAQAVAAGREHHVARQHAVARLPSAVPSTRSSSTTPSARGSTVASPAARCARRGPARGGTSAGSRPTAGAGSCRARPRPPAPNCASNQARKVSAGRPSAGPVSSLGERSVSMRAVVAQGPSKPAGDRSKMRARRPRCASVASSARPAMPPPTMATSQRRLARPVLRRHPGLGRQAEPGQVLAQARFERRQAGGRLRRSVVGGGVHRGCFQREVSSPDGRASSP